jgi:hypothetical protein
LKFPTQKDRHNRSKATKAKRTGIIVDDRPRGQYRAIAP